MYTQIDLHAYSPDKANRKLHLIMCRCPAAQLPSMFMSQLQLQLQVLHCIQVSEVQFIFMLCSVVLAKREKKTRKPNENQTKKLKPANARVPTIHKINKS